MKEFARKEGAANCILGLVPTMGALHEGHLSLIKRARQDCTSVVASIFVNPKQFGPAEDFAKYPRAQQADTEKVAALGIECVFIPEPAEMYPPDYSTYVNVDGLSDRLEGRTRPGHFCGVSTVVLKLLQIVQPQFAYFGRKDAQQAAVLSRMASDLNLDAEIIVCPIVREADGLAMSSRNTYLNPADRKAATVLHRAQQAVQNELRQRTRDALQLQATMRHLLQQEPRAEIDYAEIVDARTFEPVAHITRSSYALLAAKFGETRLLDNLLIEFNPGNSDEPHIEL